VQPDPDPPPNCSLFDVPKPLMTALQLVFRG
jgi:hypothetical protein